MSSGISIAIAANVWQTLSAQPNAFSAVRLQLIAIVLLAITIFCCNAMVNMAIFPPDRRKIPPKPSSTQAPATGASNVTLSGSFSAGDSMDKVSEWLKAVESQPRHDVVKKLFPDVGSSQLEPELAAVSQSEPASLPTSTQPLDAPLQTSAAPSPAEDAITIACKLVDSIPVDGRISPDALACITDALQSNPNNAEVRAHLTAWLVADCPL